MLDRNHRYPCISIIIVNYNGINILPNCLNALTKTCYPDFEVIIVDNGSNDASIEFLENFKEQSRIRMTIIKNELNLGFAEANNIGVACSSCKYVAFLNNDTLVDENWLGILVNALEGNPTIGAVQSLLLRKSGEVDSIGAAMDIFGTASDLSVPIKEASRLHGISEIFSACAAAMLIRRELFNRVGGFDPKFFAYYEDADLSWRIRLFGYKVFIDFDSIVYHLRGTTSNKFKGNLFDYHLYKNQLAMLIKNHTLKSLIFVMPVVCLLYFFRLVNGLMKNNLGLVKVTLKAILWNFLELAYLMGQRRYIKKFVRRVHDDQVRACMSVSPLQLWR